MHKRREQLPRPARREQKLGEGADAGVKVQVARTRRPGSGKNIANASGLNWRPAYALIPVALAVASAFNTLGNGFAADDSTQILGNDLIKHLGNLPAVFSRSVWQFASNNVTFTADSYYRPLFSALLVFNYAIFGDHAWGWHLVNLSIHAGVVLLAFVTIAEATRDKWIAAIASAFFAVHPVHSETVAWVSGITDAWMALFALPSIYFYWRFRSLRKLYLLAASVGFYFLALLVKETAVAGPIVILCCDLFYFDGTARSRIKTAALAALAFAGASIVYVVLRAQVLGGVLGGNGPLYPLLPSLRTLPLALIDYLRLSVYPAGYSYQHYVALVETWGSVSFLGPLALILILFTAVIASRSRLVRFGSIWFVAWIAPALAALRRFGPESRVQERYLYLAVAGVCIIAASIVVWLAGRTAVLPADTRGGAGPGEAVELESDGAPEALHPSNADSQHARGRRRATAQLSAAVKLPGLVVAVLTAASIIGLGCACAAQNSVWQDDVTVYQNAVANQPGSPLALASLAAAFERAGRSADAGSAAEAAVDAGPTEPMAYIARAYVAASENKNNQAIGYLEQGASAIAPSDYNRFGLATLYLNLGLLYQTSKVEDKAEEWMRRSGDLFPRPVSWFYLGQFYERQNRYQEALRMYQAVEGAVPSSFASVHLRIARVYDALSDPGKAKPEYGRYLDLAPAGEDREAAAKRFAELQPREAR